MSWKDLKSVFQVAGLFFLGIIAIGALLGVGIAIARLSVPDQIGLPLLVIVGTVVMLLTLASTSILLEWWNLGDRTQALALPEGSVRAVIALILVLIFAITTLFLYGNVASRTSIRVVDNLSNSQMKTLRDAMPPSLVLFSSEATPDNGTAKLAYRVEGNSGADDFAKQIFILIGTLVTSVASFYFGSKTASSQLPSGTLSTAPAPQSITPKTPYKLGSGATAYTIEGRNLRLVNAVSISRDSDRIEASGVSPNETSVRFTINIPTGRPSGEWEVTVTDSQGRTGKLPAGSGLQVEQ